MDNHNASRLEIAQQIAEWAYDLPEESMRDLMNNLELRVEDNPSQNVDRLIRRLRGDYTAEDFVESSDPEQITTSRRAARFQKILLMHRSLARLPDATKSVILEQQRPTYDRSSEMEFTNAAAGGVLYHSSPRQQLGQNAFRDVAQNAEVITAQDGSESRWVLTESEGRIITTTVTTTTATLGAVYTLDDNLIDLAAPASRTSITATTTTTVTSSVITPTVSTMVNGGLSNIQPQAGGTWKENEIRDRGQQERAAYAEECEKLRNRIKSLEYAMQQMLQQSHQTADSITQVTTTQPSKQVHFQDTFNIRHIEPNAHSTRNSGLNPQANVFLQPAGAECEIPQVGVQQQRPPWPGDSRKGGGLPWGNSNPFREEAPAPTYSNVPFMTGSSYPFSYPTMSAWGGSRRDIGKIAREWNIKFDGHKDSCIEEFIQRVNECRTSSHLDEEDSLNALLHVLTGPALIWCRQLRPAWSTWSDFCQAARRSYGVNQDIQMQLLAEAQARTQGKKEAVRDHIFAVLTILSRLDVQPPVEAQLSMIYDNMLAEIKMLVPKHKVVDLDALITLARAAEKLIHDRDHYKAPPPPDVCLLPQVAYKEPMEEPAKKATPSRTTAVAEITEMPAATVFFATAFKEALAQLGVPGSANSQSSQPRQAIKAGEGKKNNRRNKPKGTSSVTIEEVEDDTKKLKVREPASNHNATQAIPGPCKPPVKCYGCAWLGYMKKYCPECSQKAGKDQGKQ